MLGRARQLEQWLLERTCNAAIGIFSILNFALNKRLQVWEVFLHALFYHCEAFLSSLTLLLDIVLKNFLFFPDCICCTLDNLLPSRFHIGEPLLQERLPSSNFCLSLAQLLCLVFPFHIQEIHNTWKLTVDLVKLSLWLIESFFEDVFELTDLSLVFDSSSRFWQF